MYRFLLGLTWQLDFDKQFFICNTKQMSLTFYCSVGDMPMIKLTTYVVFIFMMFAKGKNNDNREKSSSTPNKF